MHLIVVYHALLAEEFTNLFVLCCVKYCSRLVVTILKNPSGENNSRIYLVQQIKAFEFSIKRKDSKTKDMICWIGEK